MVSILPGEYGRGGGGWYCNVFFKRKAGKNTTLPFISTASSCHILCCRTVINGLLTTRNTVVWIEELRVLLFINKKFTGPPLL